MSEYTEYQDGEGKKAFLNTTQTTDNSGKNKATLAPKGGVSAEQDNSEVGENLSSPDTEEKLNNLEAELDTTLTAMFEGTGADSSFVEKIKTVFVAALNEKVSIIEDAILVAAQELIVERVNEATVTLTEQIDNYLTYVAEEWMTENKLQVEQGFRTEIAENFMQGMKELFDNSFVDIPQDKHNIVDDLFAENSELETQVNKTLAENLQLKNEIVAHECATAFVEISSDLADTEIEKLQKLSEGLAFNDVTQYVEKLNILKESYFGANAKDFTSTANTVKLTPVLTEEYKASKDSRPFADSEMSAYVRAISKLNKK